LDAAAAFARRASSAEASATTFTTDSIPFDPKEIVHHQFLWIGFDTWGTEDAFVLFELPPLVRGVLSVFVQAELVYQLIKWFISTKPRHGVLKSPTTIFQTLGKKAHSLVRFSSKESP
jgi:hypothetical protein